MPDEELNAPLVNELTAADAQAIMGRNNELLAALDALVVEGERGGLRAMRPSGASALQEASRILKRPGF